MRNAITKWFQVLVVLAATSCTNDEVCPEAPAEIAPTDVWKCTSLDEKRNLKSLDGECDPNSPYITCCYGLTCDPKSKTCQVDNRGRIGAPCKSAGDCVVDLRCNADGMCVEDTFQSCSNLGPNGFVPLTTNRRLLYFFRMVRERSRSRSIQKESATTRERLNPSSGQSSGQRSAFRTIEVPTKD